MRVWLDDVRNPNDHGWNDAIWATNARDAIILLETGNVKEISFDHDLGEGLTGYDVANKIEELIYYKKINMPKWFIHSANPVGRANIEKALISAEKFYLK